MHPGLSAKVVEPVQYVKTVVMHDEPASVAIVEGKHAALAPPPTVALLAAQYGNPSGAPEVAFVHPMHDWPYVEYLLNG